MMIAEVKERLRTELDRAAHALTAGTAPGLAGVAVAGAPAEGSDTLRLKVRRLRQLDAGLPALEPAALPADRAGYGSSVVLEDLATRRRVSYTLVTGDVIDLEEDQVTLASPIGSALLGRGKGERVEVELPQGRRRFRIVSLTTLPQMLGLDGSR
jgi:transcription elongation GreA/GreB family factor